jgi:DNA-binding beta-propeller fold protein YncE
VQSELSPVAQRSVPTAPSDGWFRLVVAGAFLLTSVSAFAVTGQAYRDNSRAAYDGGLLAIVQPRYHAVVLFDARSGTPVRLLAFGRYGRQAGDLIRPTGIAVDARRGLVYVSDTDNDRIEAFRLEREAAGVVRSVSFAKAVGRNGSQPGEFKQPAGLALDREGNLYVCDAGNARVQVLNPKLTFIRQWGGAGSALGQFDTPASIAVSQDGDTVFVSDIGRLQLQAFERDGTVVSAWGTPRHPDRGLASGELAFPFAIAAAEGFIYVSDSRRQDVQKFRGPTLVKAWGGAGNEDGRFFQPEGVAVIDGGRVLVIDQGGHRGQIFSPDGAFIMTFLIPAGDLFPWPTPLSR